MIIFFPVSGPGILSTPVSVIIWTARTSACDSESPKSYGGC